MRISTVSTFLRRVLFADAATCISFGLLLMAGAGSLEQILGVAAAPLRYTGVSLFPFAGFLIYLATRDRLSRTGVWTAILLNAIWTADSILLLLTGWLRPTELGYAFVLVQAMGVSAFAALEYFGLRKSLSPAA